jgi:hypothetical protein
MKGGPGAVVEYLHLCPGGLGFESASLQNNLQGKGCLEIPFPRPHNVWELSALGMPFVTIEDILIHAANTSFIYKTQMRKLVL